jgi:hypothetical protein
MHIWDMITLAYQEVKDWMTILGPVLLTWWLTQHNHQRRKQKQANQE